MTGSNPLLQLRLFAKELIDELGQEVAYLETNENYPNAPQCKHLDEWPLIVLLKERIASKYGKHLKINITYDPATENMSVSGMYVYLPQYNRIVISINDKLNYCWKKFTVVKELCHIFFDSDFDANIVKGIAFSKEDNYRHSLEKVFEETQKFKDFNFSSLDDYLDMGEEMFVALLVTELMIPIYEREAVLKLVSQIGDKFTTNDIAKSLLVPEYILQKYINLNAINSEPKYTDFNS